MVTDVRLSKPVELTDAELDSVAGGLAIFGAFAQENGGQRLGGELAGGELIRESVSTYGGQVTGQTISHTLP